MRFVDPLDGVLGSSIRLRLLRALWRFWPRGLTGRELARAIRASPSRVISELGSLESEGVIFKEVAGRSHVWRLAEGHQLFPALRSLFRAEASVRPALISELQRTLQDLPVEKAMLFGSVARGDSGPQSDVDLWIQLRTPADRDEVEDALSEASAKFALRFGNPISGLVTDRRPRPGASSTELRRRILAEGIEIELGK